MNRRVDAYFAHAHDWPDELVAMRELLQRSPLVEDLKWAKPCYTHDGHNVLILQDMKPHLAVMFFRGILLRDPERILHEVGPNSHAARRILITSVDQVTELSSVILDYIDEAIDAVDADLPAPARNDIEWAPELLERQEADPAFRAAFVALTPGRQREYNLHISSAKRPATRAARVDKYADRILAGKGMRD